MEKELYIVATPIGNLQDITARALETLKSVDVIFCEDTRVTGKLLNHYNISKKMISLHQHSSDEKIKSLFNQFGKIAYASDAGTPGISDPGNKIVKIAVESGFKIIPIPGACAAISALSVSGFPTDKFLFLGFMPMKGRARTYELIKNSENAICFYESNHRIERTLKELQENMPVNKSMILARELTKMFETIYRGRPEEILQELGSNPKGECVVVISPPQKS